MEVQMSGKLTATIPQDEADVWFTSKRAFLKDRFADQDQPAIEFNELRASGNDDCDIPADHVHLTLFFNVEQM